MDCCADGAHSLGDDMDDDEWDQFINDGVTTLPEGGLSIELSHGWEFSTHCEPSGWHHPNMPDWEAQLLETHLTCITCNEPLVIMQTPQRRVYVNIRKHLIEENPW